jgi:methylenetetrahydrofolate dehydrogenase (NADP+)/methenyltetrahydrofolate cyclohydrolase
MAQLLKGLSAANALTDVLAERAAALHAKNVTPTLAILRVGERPDDISYETGAMKRCAKVGIAVRHFLLKADCTTDELLNTIREINEDPSIHGCLMFRPLPDKAMEEAACALLSPEKDVDCMTAASLTAVFTGNGAGYPPCTAQAVLELLDHYGIELSGKRVCVIGRSLVIGKPVSMMLQARNATVTMCHTKTINLAQTCRDAEILVVAAGKAGIVDGSFAAPGQIIVDVGIHVNEEGKLCGDVLFDEAEPIVEAITPVPGGVGSVTTAVLAKHVIQAAEKTLL